jgi:hypothetical protein
MMKDSHKNGIAERAKELDKLIKIEEQNSLPKEKEEALFNRIRNGDETAIEPFIACHDLFILRIAKQVGTAIPIEDVLEIGRKELYKLALQELNATCRERYYRFFAWCVRQRLLGEEMERID